MNILMVGNHFSDIHHNPNVWQDLAYRLRGNGNHVITTSNSANKILRLTDMLYTIWSKREQYEVAEVDVFSGQAFTWADFSARLLNYLQKPYILTLHGGNLPSFAEQNPKRVSNLLNSAKIIVAPSAYLKEKMQQYCNNIIVLPNGINLEDYSFIQREKTQPNLVWLRAFHKIYNPELAVKVLALVVLEFPNAKLTMIGPEKDDRSFEKTIRLSKELDVSNSVEYTGKINKKDISRMLNKGDIFLNTSNYDNTPVSVIEAMACGLCIVSTDVGGVPYLIEDQVNGLLVPPNDPQSMAKAVVTLLSKTELTLGISHNARVTVEKNDWSKILPEWETLFMNLR